MVGGMAAALSKSRELYRGAQDKTRKSDMMTAHAYSSAVASSENHPVNYKSYRNGGERLTSMAKNYQTSKSGAGGKVTLRSGDAM
jgi:hypothetical protein